MVTPTGSELEILNVLWQCGPSTVRFVNEQLNKEKQTGYTTTLKIMQIMNEKGLVSRNEESRSHVYQAENVKKDTQKTTYFCFWRIGFEDDYRDPGQSSDFSGGVR